MQKWAIFFILGINTKNFQKNLINQFREKFKVRLLIYSILGKTIFFLKKRVLPLFVYWTLIPSKKKQNKVTDERDRAELIGPSSRDEILRTIRENKAFTILWNTENEMCRRCSIRKIASTGLPKVLSHAFLYDKLHPLFFLINFLALIFCSLFFDS